MEQMIPNLMPIAFEYLYEGMEAIDDIYNFDGKLILLRKGDIIDSHKLSKLRKFNSNRRNINVLASTYELLMEKKNPSDMFAQKYLEDQIGYTQLRDATSNFLQELRYSQKVESKNTEIIQNEVSDKIENVDIVNIFQCINAPRPIDEYLQRHSVNVSILNGLIGKWLNLSEQEISLLILAGLVHDTGKTKIPAEILDAPRRLTPEEFAIIKKHPTYSYELLCDDESFDERVRLAARHHHEKITGGGYPDNLSGHQISKFAKITAISDIYDAMVSQRSYKESQNPLTILSQFAQQKFDGLDMQLVGVFLQKMPMQFINKSALMSDGTIGKILYIMPNDVEFPIIDVDGEIRQTSPEWNCTQIIIDEKNNLEDFDDTEDLQDTV